MELKNLPFFIIALSFLIASPVFAYTRTPSGFSINNPVNFVITQDDFDNYCDIEAVRMAIGFNQLIDGEWQTTFYPLAEHSWFGDFIYNYPPLNKTITLPTGDYGEITILCVSDSSYLGEYDLEYDDDNVIFTILAGGSFGFGSFIPLPMASGTDMMASVGGIFSDLWYFLAIFLGIPFGFYIITRIKEFVPKDTTKKNDVKFDVKKADKLIKEYKRDTEYLKRRGITLKDK